MKRFIALACSIVVFLLQGAAYAQNPAQPLSLREVLLKAEGYNPAIKAAVEEEHAAGQFVRERQSLYYPTLDGLVLDSAGFPASVTAPSGFDGLMMSPYRVGLAGGVYTTLTLFDLTREYGVQAAQLSLRASRQATQLRRLQVDLQAMNLFMDAVVNREQREAWKEIQGEIDRLYGIVKKYVKNGQYSEVTQWLLKDQTERANRNQEVFDQAYRSAIRRLEILTGAPQGSVAVADIGALTPSLAELLAHQPDESPMITTPRSEALTAHATATKAAAQNYPRLIGVASAGGMQDSRLVPVENYAGWIGLTFPIFEGFRISAQEQRAQAEAQKSDDLLEQAQLNLADTDTKYAEEARAREIEVTHFKTQREYSLKALKLAEHRFKTFVGDLADVRDALYSYEDAESGLNQSRAELYRSKLARAIINGATVRP